MLGSAISYPSVLLGVGAAALAGELLGTGAAWALGSFAASTVYLLVAAVELRLGERAGARQAAEDADR